MNSKINQNITFVNVENKKSINDNICSVDGCSQWGTHHAFIDLNGVTIFISFCRNHAEVLQEDIPSDMNQYPYHAACNEDKCANIPTRAGIIEINGLSITIYVCDIHAQQIGNVRLNGEELIKIPTFKCIPDEYTGSMSFFYPYCNELHKHSEGDGMRSSHCTSDSPLLKTGYFVEMLHYDELLEIKESIDSFLEFES